MLNDNIIFCFMNANIVWNKGGHEYNFVSSSSSKYLTPIANSFPPSLPLSPSILLNMVDITLQDRL